MCGYSLPGISVVFPQEVLCSVETQSAVNLLPAFLCLSVATAVKGQLQTKSVFFLL